MEEQNNMTTERSLEIITRSIEQARRDIERGSWKFMLLWGVAVTIIALIVGHLWAHYPMGPAANGLWGALGIIGLVDNFMKKRDFLRKEHYLCVDMPWSNDWSHGTHHRYYRRVQPHSTTSRAGCLRRRINENQPLPYHLHHYFFNGNSRDDNRLHAQKQDNNNKLLTCRRRWQHSLDNLCRSV